MKNREPPLARDLSGVEASYGWKSAQNGARAAAGPSEGSVEGSAEEGEPSEAERLRADVDRLTDALEDVVALALSGADYKERAIMMHRRAVAALSGVPVGRAGEAAPDSTG